MFITWDDCGCFYDQVPPGTNPDGTPQGPRVPMIIVSPYAIPGFTDTTATTFAGILAYTEHTFGLAPLGVNDAGAYPFSNAFNYSQAPHKPVPYGAPATPGVGQAHPADPGAGKGPHLGRARRRPSQAWGTAGQLPVAPLPCSRRGLVTRKIEYGPVTGRRTWSHELFLSFTSVIFQLLRPRELHARMVVVP